MSEIIDHAYLPYISLFGERMGGSKTSFLYWNEVLLLPDKATMTEG